jgi:hypothetical protein
MTARAGHGLRRHRVIRSPVPGRGDARHLKEQILIKPETVRTERLVLLPLLVEHAEEMAALLTDPLLHTFTGGSPLSAEALRSRYERLMAGSPDPAVAWVIGSAWQRRGIAAEAAVGLVAWLAQQPVRTVIAHIHPDHRASAAVAAAAGLTATDQQHDGEIRWQREVGD